MRDEIHIDRAIRGESGSRGVWAAVGMLATRQFGVVARQQLLALGLGDDVVDRAIRAGRLHVIHRGVYAVGHRSLGREGRYLAAVLAAGDGAALSHGSAADLWDVRSSSDRRVHVTSAANRRGDDLLAVHRARLDATEVATRRGIPVTTPLRTILDVAPTLTERQLERAIRSAEYEHLTTVALLADAVRARPRQRGNAKLRKVLAHLGAAPGQTKSDLEIEFLRFLRRHRLPMPETNQEIRLGTRRIEVDCIWPERRLIVELDGRDAHLSQSAFEADRARDTALQAKGYRTARITSARMTTDAKALATQLRALTS